MDKISWPMLIGIGLAMFGLVMSYISPGSFWPVVSIVLSELAGAVMLHIAREFEKDPNLIIAGWISFLGGMIVLIALVTNESSARFDADYGRVGLEVVMPVVRSCGDTIDYHPIILERMRMEKGGLESGYLTGNKRK